MDTPQTITYICGHRKRGEGDPDGPSPAAGPFYSIFFILIGEEFSGITPCGSGLGDMEHGHRRQAITDVLDWAKFTANTSGKGVGLTQTDVPRVFVIHNPPHGVVIVFAVPTANGARAWSQSMQTNMARPKSKKPQAGGGAAAAPDVAITGAVLRDKLNACMAGGQKWMDETSPHMNTSTLVAFASICDVLAADTGPPEDDEVPAPGDNAPVLTRLDVATVRMLMTRGATLNPMVCLGLGSQAGLGLDARMPAFGFMCPEKPGSIFTVNNDIIFANLPPGVEMYEIGDIPNPGLSWPWVSPPAAAIRAAFEHAEDMVRAAVRACDDDMLAEAVVTGRPVRVQTDAGEIPVVIPHPSAKGVRIERPFATGDMSMDYLNKACEMFRRCVATAGSNMPADDRTATQAYFTEMLVTLGDIVARVIGTMAEDTRDTPTSCNVLASDLGKLLSTVGMHCLPKEDRPCTDGAHLAFECRTFKQLGAGSCIGDVAIPVMQAGLSVYATNSGSVNMVISGVPGTGKTHTMMSIIPLVFYIVIVTGFSPKAMYAAGAFRKFCTTMIGIDEGDSLWSNMAPELVGMWKALLSGFNPLVRHARFTNNDHSSNAEMQSKNSQYLPSPVHITCTTNARSVSDVFAGTETQNLAGRKGMEDRFTHILQRPGNANDSALKIVNASMSRGTGSDLAKIAAPLRFMYSCTAMVLLLIRGEAVRTPDNRRRRESLIARVQELCSETRFCSSIMGARTMINITTLATIDAVKREVFERIIMGKDEPCHDMATLCRTLALIALIVTPSETELLRAISFVLRSRESDSVDTAQTGLKLLQYMPSGTALQEHNHRMMFVLSKQGFDDMCTASACRPVNMRRAMDAVDSQRVDGTPPSIERAEDGNIRIDAQFLSISLLNCNASLIDSTIADAVSGPGSAFIDDVPAGFSNTGIRARALFDAIRPPRESDRDAATEVMRAIARRVQIGVALPVRLLPETGGVITVAAGSLTQDMFLPQPATFASVPAMSAAGVDLVILFSEAYMTKFRNAGEHGIPDIIRRAASVNGCHPLYASSPGDASTLSCAVVAGQVSSDSYTESVQSRLEAMGLPPSLVTDDDPLLLTCHELGRRNTPEGCGTFLDYTRRNRVPTAPVVRSTPAVVIRQPPPPPRQTASQILAAARQSMAARAQRSQAGAAAVVPLPRRETAMEEEEEDEDDDDDTRVNKRTRYYSDSPIHHSQ
jgi:hypothetical protein